jgi:carboxyl-terminal processing protease
VLVDGFTAAGGEIIAGALQARQRGVIIGNTTSGFAHVDTVFSLARGNLAGSIIFPTGRITLPGNQALAGHGLAPTVCLADPNQPPDVRLEAGARRMAAFTGDARVALSDAEWVSMLAVCPPDVNDSEGDAELEIADRIIRDGALYRRLLESVPPNPNIPAENTNVPWR